MILSVHFASVVGKCSDDVDIIFMYQACVISLLQLHFASARQRGHERIVLWQKVRELFSVAAWVHLTITVRSKRM